MLIENEGLFLDLIIYRLWSCVNLVYKIYMYKGGFATLLLLL